MRLTFAARGDVWRVARRYGPDAPEPSHVLERLDGDGGPVIETTGGEEAVGAALARIVGMSFRAFTSAVLLAQGRFAEFLGAQPRDRDAILRELFNVASLEGARLAAGRAQAAAEGEADAYERGAGRLPGHGARARSQAARALRDAAARHAAARRLVPLARAAAAHAEAAAASRTRAAAARAAAAELPDDAAGADLIGRLDACGAAAAAARKAQAVARRRATTAETAVAGLRERHGGDGAALAGLSVRAEAAERLAGALPGRREALTGREAALAARAATLGELRATLLAAEAERDTAVAQAAAVAAWAAAGEAVRQAADAERRAVQDAKTASTGVATADAALAAADAHARALRRADLAAAIRADLAEGDPCPVCGAEVGAHDVATGDVHGAEAALAAARAAAVGAARAQAEAEERLRAATEAGAAARGVQDAAGCGLAAAGLAPETAEERAASLAGRAETLEPAIAAARAGVEAEVRAVAAEESELRAAARAIAEDAGELDAARRALGAWAEADDAGGALRGAIAEVTAAEEAARAAERGAREAAAACAEADRSMADLVAGPVAQLRAVAARVAARGGFDAPADDAAPADLVAAAVLLRAAALAAGDAHEAEAEAAGGRAAAALEALAAAGAGVGVQDAAQVDGAVRRLAGARDAARARLAEVEGAAAEARRLLADASAARARARVHQQVANDLRANMFPRFLLNRFQERLATGASIRLQELTNDAYRFAGTGADALAVVDMRRGERQRKASTLSGGERFLASLALALGLADIAAESGGRLDCLFLDEGFSTLDADSLEQALAGIERLAGDGRLVAVITHLPGVADRLGAAIHVEKDVAGVSRIRSDDDGEVSPSAAPAMMPA